MDVKSVEARSLNMSHIRSRDTSPELFIRRLLFSQGFRYRVSPGDVTGKPDLWFASRKAAIFVHGCFWHRHSGCRYATTPACSADFWQTKFQRNIDRDRYVAEQLEQQGKRLLIIWECTIRKMKKDSACCDLILEQMKSFLNSDVSYLEI